MADGIRIHFPICGQAALFDFYAVFPTLFVRIGHQDPRRFSAPFICLATSGRNDGFSHLIGAGPYPLTHNTAVGFRGVLFRAVSFVAFGLISCAPK